MEDVGEQQTLRNQTGLFQGRPVALDQSTYVKTVKAMSAHVEALSGLVTPTAGLFATAALENATDSPVEIDSKDLVHKKISGENPHYPQGAKDRHSTGAVVMGVNIGTDGAIRSLHLLEFPDPELAAAAVDAVRTWRYKPFQINGKLTEVGTQITVHFEMSSSYSINR